MSNNTWEYCGLYGDESHIITIKTLPQDLSDDLKKAIKDIYPAREKDDLWRIKHHYDLEDLGLLKEVGNAWNKYVMWAPQVHEWMKGENTNETRKQDLLDQYK